MLVVPIEMPAGADEELCRAFVVAALRELPGCPRGEAEVVVDVLSAVKAGRLRIGIWADGSVQDVLVE